MKKSVDLKYLILVLTAVFILSVLVLSGCGNQQPQQGDQGAPGKNGNDGHTPVVDIVPATLVECPTGGLEVDIDGANSGVVCNGVVGSTGPTGTPGQDLTPITIVQFCPGTTVYPSEFNEIGYCLGGNIYATYSANGGFSTLIPPGAYSSNAIGSSCNFTVLPDCGVSN